MRSASLYTPLLLDGLVLTLEAIRAVHVWAFLLLEYSVEFVFEYSITGLILAVAINYRVKPKFH